MDAIEGIVDDHPELEYRIIGDGPRATEIADRIRNRGLENYVHMLGRVSDEQLIRELDEATAFPLPCVIASDGDRDGIPVALMEAMAMGTVQISASVSGIPELIDHEETGLLCEQRDTEALSGAIELVLQNPSEAVSIAKRARRHVISEYSSKIQAQKNEPCIYSL